MVEIQSIAKDRPWPVSSLQRPHDPEIKVVQDVAEADVEAVSRDGFAAETRSPEIDEPRKIPTVFRVR